ncbi:Protein MIZU-KUSSEI 1-like, plant [Sesbania bispinosa]|nr:Protein MIZU-KUSSEI 1-like, plant [Sesbania bispinosa]
MSQMKTIMAAKSPHDSSFSFSGGYFHWKKKALDEDDDEEEILNISSSSHFPEDDDKEEDLHLHLHHHLRVQMPAELPMEKKKALKVQVQVSSDCVHKESFTSQLWLLRDTCGGEMASGLVRIALECEKKTGSKGVKLLEEPLWRTYCNGRKCGYANRRECGAEEWKILKAVEPISMGAGVLPSGNELGPKVSSCI